MAQSVISSSRSPETARHRRTYRATVTYDVAFEPSERRVRARFRDTFLLRDADDGTDRDDLFGSVRGSFVADRAVVQRRLDDPRPHGRHDPPSQRRGRHRGDGNGAVAQPRGVRFTRRRVGEDTRTRPRQSASTAKRHSPHREPGVTGHRDRSRSPGYSEAV